MKDMVDSLEIHESRGVRTLHFGSDWVQGAMRVSRPWDLELAYTKDMMAGLLLAPAWPQMPARILQIGLGAGSLTRFFHHYLPDAHQTVVEISPAVVGAACQMFQLPPCSERLVIEIAEGANWLDHANQSFDLILVDGFDADSRTGVLESLGFYQQCRHRLTPGGILVVNLLSRSTHFLEACLNLDAAFEGRTRLLPQTPGGNVIALAALAETIQLNEAILRERVAMLDTQTGLDLMPLVERLMAQEEGLPFGV
jgi:spermidine synthase